MTSHFESNKMEGYMY